MNKEIKEDELIKSNRKFFNYLISLRNRDLRKEIENCNWNAILQLIRYCEYEITNLQKENEEIKDQKKKAIEYIKEHKDKYYHDWGEDDGSYDTYLDETEIDKLSNILNGGVEE